jgi:hypothetical protein
LTVFSIFQPASFSAAMPSRAKRIHSACVGSNRPPLTLLSGSVVGATKWRSVSSASASSSAPLSRWMISVTSPFWRTTRCDGSNETRSPS